VSSDGTQADPVAGDARLARLAPLAALSTGRLAELAAATKAAHAARGSDALAEYVAAGSTAFLLRGEILLCFAGGGSLVVVGGSGDGLHPLNRRQATVVRSKAITDVELLLIDDDALDIAVTWDQVAAGGGAGGGAVREAARSDGRFTAGAISLEHLRHGVFAQLPAARIEELLRRFERMPVRSGQVVVREGEEGDWFYVIAAGKCQVERTVGGVRVAVAELKSGDAFGEEALVSQAKRNATVTMLADGELLRLSKGEVTQLLVEPLLHRLGWAEACDKVARGARWLDVRYPSEYQHDRLSGAINVPLSEVRNSFSVLDAHAEYVVYCQSGRRSSAAAFLFAQRGFRVWLLDGGLWAAQRANAR
jgi:rhodanese-related sulfurtransferase